MNWYVCGKLFYLGLALFALSSIGCGRTNLQDSELPSPSGRFVAVTSGYLGVVLVIAPEGSGICSGNIVSKWAVLTAAHCLLRNGTYTVRTSQGEFTTSTKILNGPGVVDDPRDIGLLIFNSAITDGSNGEIYSIGSDVSEGQAVTLVGYGCNSREARTGAGIKRMGTNVVSEVNSEYIVLLTPVSSGSSRALIGDSNQTGTCFGDSGSGLLANENGRDVIVGVTHAGGTYSGYYVSEFTNTATYSPNLNFLRSANSSYSLGIQGL